MALTTMTTLIYKTARRIIIPIVLIGAYSLIFLSIGVKIAFSESPLHRLLIETGMVKFPEVPTYIQPPSFAAFNNYGQLAKYAGKVQVERPIITPKTMVLFVFGQSNSANYGGEKFVAASDHIYNFWDGAFYRAEDPLLGASGFSGSVWVDLANKLIEKKMADAVILIPSGIGGSSVQHWQPGAVLNPMLLKQLESAKQANLEVTHFLWHQGEADQALDHERYKHGLDYIIQTTQRYFPHSKFFVAQASRCGSMPPSAALQATQRDMSRQPGVFLGPNTDLIEPHDRYDDCHFSGNGLKLAADGWLAALKENRQEK